MMIAIIFKMILVIMLVLKTFDLAGWTRRVGWVFFVQNRDDFAPHLMGKITSLSPIRYRKCCIFCTTLVNTSEGCY